MVVSELKFDTILLILFIYFFFLTLLFFSEFIPSYAIFNKF